MKTETILKMHLGKAYKTWQDAKMEADFYCEGYDVVQTEQYCYDTLALACKDIGIELTEEEKDAIKKELVEKWDEIKRKDAEKWELKEKYFHEVVVPRAETYKKELEKAESGAEVKELESDFYSFLRVSAQMLEMSAIDLEEKLADVF